MLSQGTGVEVDLRVLSVGVNVSLLSEGHNPKPYFAGVSEIQ